MYSWQVKLRIGVDEHESYEFFRDFVMRMHAEGGCEKFIVHSRKVTTRSNLNADRMTSLPVCYLRGLLCLRDA